MHRLPEAKREQVLADIRYSQEERTILDSLKTVSFFGSIMPIGDISYLLVHSFIFASRRVLFCVRIKIV